jgi:hypothetical protein
MTARKKSPLLKFHPVTPSRWKDFEKLFGDKGACGGCWCMSPRRTPSEFLKTKGSANKRAIKKIIDSGKPPGVIGIVNGEPVAWCCVGPRQDFIRLQNSRTMKPIDDQPAWCIPCLFIAKTHRKANLSSKAVDAAAKYAFSKGAKIVEGYPNDTRNKKWADPFAWMGLVSSFENAGFDVVKRPSPSRAIMRRYNSSKSKTHR